jgi:hypothetical protein
MPVNVSCVAVSAVAQTGDFFQISNRVGNARCHRWPHAQRLVNAGKIVMHVSMFEFN